MATDAVSIRLRLYDENQREINPKVVFLEHEIDAYEMNYGLNRIDRDFNLGFTKLHLTPRYHPYDYGWIPEGVSFGKIELGVNGPGEIWFDSFDLSYSKWNFPLRERIARLGEERTKDQPLSLFPIPQKVEFLADKWEINPEIPPPICIFAKELKPAHRLALQSIENKLRGSEIYNSLSQRNCIDASFHLVIGDGNIPIGIEQLVRNSQKDIYAYGTEAYELRSFHLKDGRKGIAIMGGGIRGEYYGLKTFEQLIHEDAQGKVFIQLAQIRDYPTFSFRSTAGRDIRRKDFVQELKATEWLTEGRLNGNFIDVSAHDARWWNPSYDLQNATRRLIQENQKFGLVDVGIMLNPYIHRRDAQIKKRLRFSDPRSLNEIYSTIQIFLKQGVSNVLLQTDDFPPTEQGKKFSYLLEDEKDIKKFDNLGNAHIQMIQWINQRMNNRFPKAQLYFVPPYYNNLFVALSEGFGQPYLDILSKNMPKDVPLIWTGPTVRSLWIDKVHYQKYSDFISGKIPMLWDNTLYARRLNDYWGKSPIRAHLSSFMEPYDVGVPWDYGPPSAPKRVYINAQNTELFRIQLATAGAYFWNPKDYHPEIALWSYLKNRFGEEPASMLLDFDSLLWQIAEQKNDFVAFSVKKKGKNPFALNRDKRKRFLKRSAKKRISAIEENYQKAFEILATLDKYLSILGSDLLDELRELLLKEKKWLWEIQKIEEKPLQK